MNEQNRLYIDRLLKSGGGVTLAQIVKALEPEADDADMRATVESYLIRLIAMGYARRVWNKDAADHFYMADTKSVHGQTPLSGANHRLNQGGDDVEDGVGEDGV